LAKPSFGENFVVIGLGLIGLLTAQLLVANGCNVIGFDFDQNKVELANNMGVKAFLASSVDVVKVVENLTNGIGADAVVITASSPSNEVISQAANMSRKRGRIILVGVIGLELNRAEFYKKELTFQVSCSYGPGRYDDEYEIDELTTLYKNSDKKAGQISEANIIKMICHYFSPQVEIIDNKYITNIKCNLWLKHDDINEFLESHKFNMINAGLHPKSDIISFDDLYQTYKMFFKAKGTVDQKNYPIVSKQFFEKYLTSQLTIYIKFDKFVSSEWFQS
jgi:hypothetical protein